MKYSLRNRNSGMEIKRFSQAPLGVVSLLCAVLSGVLFFVGLRMSYMAAGEGALMVGAVGLFAFFASLCGFVLGFVFLHYSEGNHAYPVRCIVLNALLMAGWIVLFVIGIL